MRVFSYSADEGVLVPTEFHLTSYILSQPTATFLKPPLRTDWPRGQFHLICPYKYTALNSPSLASSPPQDVSLLHSSVRAKPVSEEQAWNSNRKITHINYD